MKKFNPSLYSSGTELKFFQNILLLFYIWIHKYSKGNSLSWGSNFYYWLKLFLWYTYNHNFETNALWMTFILSFTILIHYCYHCLCYLAQQPIALHCHRPYSTYLAKVYNVMLSLILHSLVIRHYIPKDFYFQQVFDNNLLLFFDANKICNIVTISSLNIIWNSYINQFV